MKFKTLCMCALAAASASGLAAQEQRLIETRAFYSTNAGEAVGKPASIAIDGEFNDWTDDMIVTTGGANDQCNAFHGSHENCVLDLYAVYAAWDDANLYIAWQMCNTGDTWARPGDGPLTDGGRVGDVPLIVALSVDPASTALTGKLTDGRFIWGEASSGVTFTSHVDHLFFMSGKPGLGDPAMFTAVDAAGNTDYGKGCRTFRTSGVKYAMKEGFAPSHLWRQKTAADWADATTLISDPSIVNNIYDAENYDNLFGDTPNPDLKPHDTSFDSFYEMSIPLSELGIDRAWLEANGIGVRVVASRGESGIDCLPFDPSMVDNVFEIYGKDDSTSHEKDDIDNITYELASVGKMRTGTVTPLPIPTPTPDPEPTPDPTPAPVTDGNYTVYYDNSATAWGAVFTWIWDAADSNRNYTGGTWPGTAMTADPATGYYKYSFQCDSTAPKLMCIFNPGGDNGKTVDLDLVNRGIYTQAGFSGQYVSAVAEINAAEELPAEYFNLQGMPVSKPESGIYIERRGNSVRKVVF